MSASLQRVLDATNRLKAARSAGFAQPILFRLMVELVEEMGRSHLEQAAHMQRMTEQLEKELKVLLEGVRKIVGNVH